MPAFFAEIGRHIVHHGFVEAAKRFPIIPKLVWALFGIAIVCGLIGLI